MGTVVKRPVLTEAERDELWRIINEQSNDYSIVQRAKILLYAADGHDNASIASMLGIIKATVYTTLRKYNKAGLKATVTPTGGGGALRRFSPELKAYVCKIAFSVPRDLEGGPDLDRWKGSTLQHYLREQSEKTGFKQLKRMSESVINSIIAEAKIAAAQLTDEKSEDLNAQQ